VHPLKPNAGYRAARNTLPHAYTVIAAILLSVFASAANAQEASVCNGPDGTIYDGNCNQYLEDLYAACADPAQIRTAGQDSCVPVQEFSRPLMGCDADGCGDAHPYAGYAPYAHEKLTDTFRIEGNLGADTVVLFLQGGPSAELASDYADFLESGFLVAYVAQTNFVKPGLLDSFDMTQQQAAREQDENIELIHEAYQALRAAFPDKKISLAGHSMGAFLGAAYLARYGNPFDKVVLMAGRLDAPFSFVNRFAIGENLVYPDGIGDPDAFRDDPDNETTALIPIGTYLALDYQPNAENVMLAAIGAPRYTALLKDVDLSNLLYVYSDRDERVGALSADEIAFLESHGALVRNVGWHEVVLGHSWMLASRHYVEAIAGFLKGK